MTGRGRFAREAASSLGLDAAVVGEEFDAEGRWPWPSAFPVGELALDTVSLVSALIDAVSRQRGRSPARRIPTSRARVAASFGSERLVRVDGEPPDVWAPLSGFFRTADGWVRTHGNYPHHAARLREVLGLGEGAGADQAAVAIARWPRFALEQAAIGKGAVVAAVRGEDEWEAHPAAASIGALPLIATADLGEAAPRRWRGTGAPLAGVRVLDLTRVIAGPVATRDLALAGAAVLRVDDPHRPEIPWGHLDTGQHKRTTLLDLEELSARQVLDRLLGTADVVVTGYRPGALDRFGLSPRDLARSYPGIVVGSISAWGEEGPWAGRRGFDSIVQAATGIADVEGRERTDGRPGALPVQALDHASGHLLAAGIIRALSRQRAEGGSRSVAVVLARTALSLQRARRAVGGGDLGGGSAPTETVELALDGGGSVTCAPPPLAFAGAPRAYDWVHRWGTDAPDWGGSSHSGSPGSAGGVRGR